ncbi:membrane protein insertase YidC [Halioglobus japonicus]|uniref:Membrane protein insertase YidC n=1 Tax=Halioglobus japonicus TaxID=930805 RepID=A0AAP8MCH1_9GAMM|nr:membrane protein insertase YidC [Halioglobus japonicus]AQA17350.1 membrane protein insertase YidC [Halioglobus japonicus]PLW85271.1 membrane protein insertase YidC [Halioglobus japonicus]GHD22593.1 membrane protein insertase YidC [Halioglobus japonicus]
MDLQRSLLIGAIAVLSFMLLTEWVAFKDERESSRLPDTTRILNSDASSDQEMPTAPALSEAAGEDDIPTAPALDQASKDVPATTTDSGNIIQVHTDSLQVAIDLNGGDIIELALPRHLADIDDPNSAFVLLEQNERRIYVAQSGLIGQDGIDSNGRALFTASAERFEMTDSDDKLAVDLVWQGDNGVKVTKRFTFTRGDYLVNVDYLIENGSDTRWQANLFGQIKRDSTVAPSASASGMGMQPFLGAALTQPEERFTKFTFEDMAEEPFKAQLPAGWIAMLQHYFLSAWVPNQEQSHTYSTRVTRSGFNIAGFTSPAITLDPGQNGQVGAGFWAGPKDQYRLKEISPYLDLVVDYGWLWWIAQPLFWLLTKMYALVGNWGGAIILLTLLVKAAFFKLSATSYKSMARMRKVQPKMLEIREMYADDKQKQSQAMMDLYRKEKVNPMGGCLPILVQMPVFIALYWVLMESVELRHAPFALWINDLSVMDPYFVLPILMGASMWFMQKLNPPPTDPMQAKIMQWLPIVFTFFFLWFPAGLVLYWVVNNLLSMAQQYVITRQIEKGDIA